VPEQTNITYGTETIYPTSLKHFLKMKIKLAQVGRPKRQANRVLQWCGPGFHGYPTHFRKKRGNGWGTVLLMDGDGSLEQKGKCSKPDLPATTPAFFPTFSTGEIKKSAHRFYVLL
jgi:hypothetical protein